MTTFSVTQGKDYSHLFLPQSQRIPWEQYCALGNLSNIAVQRGEATLSEGAPHGNGWHLTTPVHAFDKLRGIAESILADNFEPLAEYRENP